MAKLVVKPSSYFLAAFCFLAFLVFNIIENNLTGVVLFFSLFFFSLLFGLNSRSKMRKSKGKKVQHINTFKAM